MVCVIIQGNRTEPVKTSGATALAFDYSPGIVSTLYELDVNSGKATLIGPTASSNPAKGWLTWS
jgi:hypothetical protein